MAMKRDNNTPHRGFSAFSVLLIMSALSVIGIALLPRLNIQYSPSPVERNITVSFSWNNASARLIEQQVTSRIEAALSVIGGCDDISSRSSKGGGSVTVKFRKGTDMTAARFEVASAIRKTKPCSLTRLRLTLYGLLQIFCQNFVSYDFLKNPSIAYKPIFSIQPWSM